MHNTVLTEYKLSINTTNLLLILPCAAGVDSGVDGGASNGVIPPSAQVESTRTYKKTGSAAPSTASQGARLATAAETSGTNPNPKFTPTAPLFTSLLTSLHYHYLLTTLSLFTSLLTSLHYQESARTMRWHCPRCLPLPLFWCLVLWTALCFSFRSSITLAAVCVSSGLPPKFL